MLPEGSDGDVSVAPPLTLEAASLSGFVDIPEVMSSVALLAAVTDRLRGFVADNFEVPRKDLKPAGVLASRLQTPRQLPSLTHDSHVVSGERREHRAGYWNPHVDKANRCLYDFSAVLYLNNFGEDFRGGRFVFLDRIDDNSSKLHNGARIMRDSGKKGEDSTDHRGDVKGDGSEIVEVKKVAVEPRAGRLIAFSSGCENVHHILT